jgi:catechol 2,3-dioxygenase-like lactoylglutathione lyase family enzyme
MGLVHVTLATRDVSRSVQFFQEVLGWMAIGRPMKNAKPACWLRIAPGQELHLVEVPEFVSSPFEQEYGRHVAVSMPQVSFPALKERLIARGAEVVEPLRDTPFERFFFRDPNGYLFEVIPEECVEETLTG